MTVTSIIYSPRYVTPPPTEAPVAYLSWMQPAYFINGTGNQTVDASERFTGGGAVTTYSLQGTPPGAVTINSSSGLITVNTASDLAWTEVTVRGANAAGYDEVTLEVRVLTPTYTIDGGTYSEWNDLPTLNDGDIIVRRATASPSTTQHNLTSDWSGSAGNEIEYLAYPGETVVLDATNITSTEGMINANTRQYLIIRGFHIKGGTSPAAGSTCNFGVSAWTGRYITVEQCHIYHFNEGAVFCGGPFGTWGTTRPFTLRYNKMYRNALKNRKADGTGGAVGSGGWGRGVFGDWCDGSTFSRNVVFENWGEGLGGLGSNNCTYTENIVWDNYSANIYMDNIANCTVEYNIVHGNNESYRKATAPNNLGYTTLIGHEELNPQQATHGLNIRYNTSAEYLPDATGGHSTIYYWGGDPNATYKQPSGSTPPTYFNSPNTSDWTTGNTTISIGQIDPNWQNALG